MPITAYIIESIQAPVSCAVSIAPVIGMVQAAGEVAAGVCWIEQILEDGGIGNGSTRDGEFEVELVALVDTGMQLVAEVCCSQDFD